MEPCLTAPFTYPDNYSFHYEGSDFENIQENIHTTHTCQCAEITHLFAEHLILPVNISLMFLATVIEPHPGENKGHYLYELAIRVTYIALFIISLPFAIAAYLAYLPFRCFEHMYRREVSFLDNSAENPLPPEVELSEETPLHIRTHNTGLVNPYMCIFGDLRPLVDRAKELVNSIKEDPLQPDILFFQEVFSEKARKIIVDGLKDTYPQIIYNFGEGVLERFNSGLMAASKVAISSFSFNMFNHMIGPEKWTHRGVLKVSFNTTDGKCLHVYSMHLQALIGDDRADARHKQLSDLGDMLRKDSGHQVVVGDLNVCSMTSWGEDQTSPKEQAEEKNLTLLHDEYTDLYLEDHSEKGKRTSGEPKYLASDNSRMGHPKNKLDEPSATWYDGPFQSEHTGLLGYLMKKDRRDNNRPTPRIDEAIANQEIIWGTDKWHATQPANASRLDRVLIPKHNETLTGLVEHRRIVVPQNAQSASSDHLYVDAKVWLKG